MIAIRTEEPADVEVIHSIHHSAFPTEAEARLVDRLREDRKLALSLIAEVRDRVEGHVAFSPVSVDPQSPAQQGVGLGPVASPGITRKAHDSLTDLTSGSLLCRHRRFLDGGRTTAELGQDDPSRTQVAMSLVSGLMLGVAFYHLLPHSVAMLPGPGAADVSVRWLMLGLITMLLLLRIFHFHQHDFSHEGEDHHDHHHQHEHGHAHSYSHPAPASRVSWLGIALGLGVHTVIDGIALGAVMQAEIADGSAGVVGLGVFLAILLHKPLDAMSFD